MSNSCSSIRCSIGQVAFTADLMYCSVYQVSTKHLQQAIIPLPACGTAWHAKIPCQCDILKPMLHSQANGGCQIRTAGGKAVPVPTAFGESPQLDKLHSFRVFASKQWA